MEEPLKHSKVELRAAARAIQDMDNATDLEIFEHHWKVFLSCIEKLWEKMEKACESSSKFPPWQGKHRRTRKKDPLLRYLKQARNADNHSIQDLNYINSGSFTVIHKDPRTGISGTKHITQDESLKYNQDELFINIFSPHPEVLPVTNKGVRYDPPKIHLGERIDDLHPSTLAVLGLKFYSELINEAEETFFKKKK